MIVKGQKIQKYKTFELTSTSLTLLLVILTGTTYILDQSKSNWVCGPVLFLLELIAFEILSVFTLIIWKTKNIKIKIIITIISIGQIAFIIWYFVKFLTNCS